VAIANEDGLRLVFREGDAPPKLFDKEIRAVLVGWDNFAGLEVKRGFFGTKLILSVQSAARLEGVPGLAENSLELEIHRSRVEDIEPFQRRVKEYQSGKVDEDIDDFVDDVRDLLDGY
jgi:hypothetical protein